MMKGDGSAAYGHHSALGHTLNKDTTIKDAIKAGLMSQPKTPSKMTRNEIRENLMRHKTLDINVKRPDLHYDIKNEEEFVKAEVYEIS